MNAIPKYLLLLGLFVAAFACLSLVSGEATADTHMWDGGGADNKFSTDANWDQGDTEPVAGDAVVINIYDARGYIWDVTTSFASVTITFPADAAASKSVTLAANAQSGTLAMSSLHAANTITLSHGANYQLTVAGAVTLGTRAIMTQGTGTWTFGSYTQNGASSVFTQGGDVVVNGASDISLGTLTGLAAATWTNVGSWAYSAGTVTNSVLNLVMSGDGKTATIPSAFIKSFTANANITYTYPGGIPSIMSLSVGTGKTLTVASGKILNLYSGGSGYPAFSNLGTIAGAGTLKLDMRAADMTLNGGRIDCAFIVNARTDAAANRLVSLGSPLYLGSTISIESAHAANTCTFDLAGYNLQCNGLTVGPRGVLLGGEGVITNAGNWDSSAGTWTPESSQVIMTGVNKTVKTAMGQTFYTIAATSTSRTTLLSNIESTHACVIPYYTLTFGAFTVTRTDAGPDTFTSAPDQNAETYLDYEYGVTTSSGFVNLTMDAKPDWLTLTGAQLVGTIPLSAYGSHQVSIKAWSIYGWAYSWQNFTLSVDYLPFSFTSQAPTKTYQEVYFQYVPATTLDAYGCNYTVTFDHLSSLQYDAANNTIQGRMAYIDVIGICIKATDDIGREIYQNVTLQVTMPMGSMTQVSMMNIIMYVVALIISFVIAFVGMKIERPIVTVVAALFALVIFAAILSDEEAQAYWWLGMVPVIEFLMFGASMRS